MTPHLKLMVLAVLTVALCAPAFGQDDDLSARIADLEKAMQQIKASMAAGEDVTARITELEAQLAQLKADAVAAQGEEAPAEDAAEEAPATAPAQLPPAGVQGAPNPLQDNIKFLTGQQLLDASFPGSMLIPGTNVRFAIGGYAKLDFIHDFDFVGDRYELWLPTIPVEGTPEATLGGRSTLHAKQSRINFDFRSTAHSKEGKEFPLQVFLEFDFFDDREEFSLQPRLRHAYGVIGRLLAGQTWSISGDLEALPGTIDFSGGDAVYGARVAQIRWQDKAGKHVTWAVGVEDPISKIDNLDDLPGVDRPELPNVGWHVRWTSDNHSHVQLGGDLFQLQWQGGASGPSDTAFGFGLNLTGRYLLGKKNRNALVGGVEYGHGSAHRVVSLEGANNDAVITPDGLDVMSEWQAYAGYSLYWTDSLNSTISTNWTVLDNSEYQPGNAIHRAASFHLNLIWFPYKLASTGAEIMWGERVDKDGASGDAWRFEYMFKFKFR